MINYSPQLDRSFQALGDPNRRAMLARLAEGPASVSELARPFAMSMAGVLQHLKVLEGCGLVRTEKVGRVRTCRLEEAPLTDVERWIADRRRTWEQRLDRLGEILQEDDPKGPGAGSSNKRRTP